MLVISPGEKTAYEADKKQVLCFNTKDHVFGNGCFTRRKTIAYQRERTRELSGSCMQTRLLTNNSRGFFCVDGCVPAQVATGWLESVCWYKPLWYPSASISPPPPIQNAQPTPAINIDPFRST